jgi:O-antigen ligase
VTGIAIVLIALNMTDPGSHDWISRLPFYGNIRLLSFFAFAATMFIAIFLVSDRKGLTVVEAWFFLTFVFGFQIWSGSRGTYLATVVALAVLIGLCDRAQKRRLCILAGSSFLFALFVTYSFSLTDHFFGVWSRTTAAGTVDQAASNRLVIWQAAMSAVSGSWLFGLGPGNFVDEVSVPLGLMVQHPHNVIVGFLFEWGVVGTALFSAWFLPVFFSGLRAALREKSTESSAVKRAMAAMLSGYLTYSLYDGIFWHGLTLMVLALGFAILLQPEVSPNRGLKSAGRQTPLRVERFDRKRWAARI